MPIWMNCCRKLTSVKDRISFNLEPDINSKKEKKLLHHDQCETPVYQETSFFNKLLFAKSFNSCNFWDFFSSPV